MSSEADEIVIGFLERQKPEEFDAFIKYVGIAFDKALPKIKNTVQSYGSNFDADEVISKGLEKAINRLIDQFNGKEQNFIFTREVSFASWVLMVIGRPGAGIRSGVIGNEIKKAKKRTKNYLSIDDYQGDLSTENNVHSEEMTTDIDFDKLFSLLESQEQLIIRLNFGYHGHDCLNQEAVYQIALSSGFSEQDAKKIKRRARSVLRTDKAKKKLTQPDIGILLDVSEKQVYIIKSKGLTHMRAVCKPSGPLAA